jgi:YggT family protein
MTVPYILAQIIGIYVWVLIVRVVFDYIQIFSPSWRPRGFIAVIADVVFRLTDPPLNALRRVVPPLRLGVVSLDLGFLILVIGLNLLGGILVGL